MKQVKRSLVLTVVLFISVFGAKAQYTETMNPNGLKKNLSDFGLVDDGAKTNQSAIFQNAIDEVSASGGGIIVVPKGTYLLSRVALRSNIHLQIEANTVLKPDWPAGTKTVMFTLSTPPGDPMDSYIENVSIRGIGGRFIVDYHDHICQRKEGCRAMIISMAKNFLVQDMDVKDNYSTYCSITLSPVNGSAKNARSWDVSRATDGTVRNCRVFKASPGYGLVQLHGARRVYFEDLYALGGVTLRLETGANNQYVGVYDITAKNITCENGRSALMMGPHSSKNGLVTVQDLKAISCTYAVQIGEGGVKKGAPDQTPGYFDSASTIKNIYAVFGKEAQVKKNSFMFIPKPYYQDLKLWNNNKFLDGPSLGAVTNHSRNYSVNVENVTMEGFKYVKDKISTVSSKDSGSWGVAFKDWRDKNTDQTYRTNKGAVVQDFDISQL